MGGDGSDMSGGWVSFVGINIYCFVTLLSADECGFEERQWTIAPLRIEG